MSDRRTSRPGRVARDPVPTVPDTLARFVAALARQSAREAFHAVADDAADAMTTGAAGLVFGEAV